MRALAMALSLALLPSCASIMDGKSHDSIMITSEPSGAEVRLLDLPVGKTPHQLQMPRSADYCNVRVVLAGYHPHPVKISKTVNGWVFGNIVFGGLIGVLVDTAGGNVTKWSDSPIHVQLVPTDQPAPTEPAMAKRKKKGGPKQAKSRRATAES